jgi:hypothetical protein
MLPMTESVHNDDSGITAEIMAVIEETAAVYLGRPVRIVSVKLHTASSGGRNTWADQGRSVQQTSHNLVQRGH